MRRGRTVAWLCSVQCALQWRTLSKIKQTPSPSRVGPNNWSSVVCNEGPLATTEDMQRPKEMRQKPR